MKDKYLINKMKRRYSCKINVMRFSLYLTDIFIVPPG